MKKRTIIFLALLLLAIGNSFGQIVYTPEDQGTHLRQQTEGGTLGVMVPLQNVTYDQFKLEMVPVGNGILLLLGLGGAYLLKKRKEK